MSLSLYGVPDGQQKGQSVWPCPSVYSPATALGSLSSVALSSAPAPLTLIQRSKQNSNHHRFHYRIWSGFLAEATNAISSGFLREATRFSEIEFFQKSSSGCTDCLLGVRRPGAALVACGARKL